MSSKSKVEIKQINIQDGGDEGKLFEAMMRTASLTTGAGVQSTDSASTAVYACLGTAVGGLQIAATLLSPRQEDDAFTEKGLNNDTFTMAVALLLVCVDLGTSGDGMTKVDYGNHKFGAAITMYKRITGKDPDPALINKNFLAAAAEAKKRLN